MLKELACAEFFAVAHVDVFRYVAYCLDDFLVFSETDSVLGVVAETDCCADVEGSAVGWHFAKEHLDECGFAGAVVAHDAHLLVAGEVVVEVLEYDFIAETFVHVCRLEYLATDVC